MKTGIRFLLGLLMLVQLMAGFPAIGRPEVNCGDTICSPKLIGGVPS